MWGNLNAITRAVGNAIEKVQKAANEIESQLDAAVDDQVMQHHAPPPAVMPVSLDTIDTSTKESQSQSNLEDAPISTSPDISSHTIASDVIKPKAKSKVKRPPAQRLPLDADISSNSLSSFESKHSNESIYTESEREYSSAVSRPSVPTISSENIPPGYLSEKDVDDLVKELKKQHKLQIEESERKIRESYEIKLEVAKKEIGDITQLKNSALAEKETLRIQHSNEIAVLQTEIDSLKIVKANTGDASSNSDAEFSLQNIIQQLQANLATSNEVLAKSKLENVTLTHTIIERDRTINELHSSVESHMNEAKSLRDGVATLTSQLKDKAASLAQFETDLLRMKEIIADRERALATVNNAMSESISSQESLQQRIASLEHLLGESEGKLKASLQATSMTDGEAKKTIAKLQESIKEKDERLAAFDTEGQSLAKRQSEMEKAVRKAKGEVKEKETEIAKLKESKDQLVKVIEELQDQVKKSEADAVSSQKSLNAMQAVSAASTDKIGKLEAELSTKLEELSTQRRALETAWNENGELKRLAVELRAERDDARRQLETGVSRVMETESSRRDIEQREAVLRATSKQLQESLQRQMQESSSREERLREEVHEMRKRWQEAISSREALSHELSSATAPLLRQISSLQDTIRIKTDNFQNIESSLSEKALKAEARASQAEIKRQQLEEQSAVAAKQISALTAKLSASQEDVMRLEEAVSSLKNHEAKAFEESERLRGLIEESSKASIEKQARLEEMHLALRLEFQGAQETWTKLLQQKESQVLALQNELELLRSGISPSLRDQASMSSPPSYNSKLDKPLSYPAGEVKKFTSLALPSGEASYAVADRFDQQLQQKNEEASSLQMQLRQIQMGRDALLEEVNYLSSKNARLEEEVSSLPDIQAQLRSLKQKNDLLLVLLGEKEEELEAALADMKEVKNLYRRELDALLESIAPDRLPSSLLGLKD